LNGNRIRSLVDLPLQQLKNALFNDSYVSVVPAHETKLLKEFTQRN
jgi:hypothetical protein